MAKKTDAKIVSTPPTQSAALQAAGQMAALPTTGQGEFLLYQTEDAQTRVQVRFEAGDVWLLDDWGIVERELQRHGIPSRRAIPEGGSTVWIDSWMIAQACEGPRLDAARAWVEYALSPENQRDLLVLAGYDPTNSRTVRLLDKRAARLRVRTLRERLEGLQRWREVPRRERYLETWAAAKRRAGR